MLLKHVQVLDPIEPEEMEMLQRVFDQVCNTVVFESRRPRQSTSQG
ncbi:hypothetical protein [Neorhizobium sp. LjRoot104]